MIRGVRGATSVVNNDATEMIQATEELLVEVINVNSIKPEDVATVLISVTEDLNATFPAIALRQMEGWELVPVMCMQEIPVPNAVKMCIRVMMTVNTDVGQNEIQHVYLKEAMNLRPDLVIDNKE